MNKNQDENLTAIEGLRWLPFVGESYGVSQKKVLLVGESHYYNPDDQNTSFEHLEFTRWIVDEMGIQNQNYGSPFFSKISQIFNGVDRTALWQKTSFYNFIQRPMDKGGKVIQGVVERPSKEDFLDGWRIFFEVVKNLNPDYCVFFGNTAANHFEKACIASSINYTPVVCQESINRSYLKKAEILYENHKTELIFIKHPSSYFSTNIWREVLNSKHPDIFKAIQN